MITGVRAARSLMCMPPCSGTVHQIQLPQAHALAWSSCNPDAMDTFATMALHLSDFLSPFSGLVRTANPFPSEPVPQVVGIGSAVSLTQAKIQPQPDIRRKGNGEHRKLGIHIRGYIHIHILERRGTCGLILNTGRYIFEEDITDEIVRLCHLYSFPLFTMPWDTRIFDITHDYYNRIFEDSRDDGNMTAAFQNILMGNSLTDEQTDTIKGSGFNNGCYNVLSIGTEATDEFMYILQKVCNNTNLVFHAFVYDGNPTVILRCPSSGLSQTNAVTSQSSSVVS